jgi:rubredoxin
MACLPSIARGRPAGNSPGPARSRSGAARGRRPEVATADRYLCPECEYNCDASQGEDREGYVPGTSWDDIDSVFFCPDGGSAPQRDFVKAS